MQPEIIDEILQEPKIQIAYPSTTIYTKELKDSKWLNAESFKSVPLSDNTIPPKFMHK